MDIKLQEYAEKVLPKIDSDKLTSDMTEKLAKVIFYGFTHNIAEEELKAQLEWYIENA
jgi:hypothetical protein